MTRLVIKGMEGSTWTEQVDIQVGIVRNASLLEWALEFNVAGIEASDTPVIIGVDICVYSILAGRDLLRQVDLLGQGHFTFLQRTLKININDLFAKIGSLPDKSDQAIFDL